MAAARSRKRGQTVRDFFIITLPANAQLIRLSTLLTKAKVQTTAHSIPCPHFSGETKEEGKMSKASSCVGCLRANSLTLATIVGVVAGLVIGVRALVDDPKVHPKVQGT